MGVIVLDTSIVYALADAADARHEETVRWYQQRQDWVAHVKSGEYQKFYEQNYARRV